MLFMVIEHFREGDPRPVYRRFRDTGRMLPDGLIYRGSWVSASLDRCFQLMECDDAALLQKWAAEWTPLVRFEIIPVTESAVAGPAIMAERDGDEDG